MIRLKYHEPGTAPGTIVTPEGEGAAPPRPTVLHLVQYDSSGFSERELDSFEAFERNFDPDQVNWVDVCGLENVALLRQLAGFFKIHALSLEDAVNTTQRPKAELFGDHYCVITDLIYEAEDDGVVVEQVSLFFGRMFVLTIREDPGRDVFNRVRARLRSGNGNARHFKADYLTYALLDATVDHFFPVLEMMGDRIEEIEEVLLEKPTKATLRSLYDCRRLLLQIRRAAWPQREIFGTLIRDDGDLVCREVQVFLRDCYDHSTQIIDIVENYRELSSGLMDVYLSSLGFRTNEIMRVLTVVSVLFIPLTFLAGVYGMNFDLDQPWNMPELRWPFGYVYFWGVCCAIVTGMVLFFKRKGWL